MDARTRDHIPETPVTAAIGPRSGVLTSCAAGRRARYPGGDRADRLQGDQRQRRPPAPIAPRTASRRSASARHDRRCGRSSFISIQPLRPSRKAASPSTIWPSSAVRSADQPFGADSRSRSHRAAGTGRSPRSRRAGCRYDRHSASPVDAVGASKRLDLGADGARASDPALAARPAAGFLNRKVTSQPAAMTTPAISACRATSPDRSRCRIAGSEPPSAARSDRRSPPAAQQHRGTAVRRRSRP